MITNHRGKRLTREQETALFADGKADEVVLAHHDFAVRCAMRYASKDSPIFPDLVQCAHIGLVIASRRWDPAFGQRFMVYARHWIKSCIHDHLLVGRRMVVVGRSAIGRTGASVMIKERPQTVEDLIARIGPTQIAEAIFMLYSSTDTTLTRTTENGEQEYLANDSDPESDVADLERCIAIRKAIDAAGLSDREREVISQRFMGDESPAFVDVGRSLGVSRQRAEQIQTRAFQKLKPYLASFQEN